MKQLIIILFTLFNSTFVWATEQEPDLLHYNGKKLALATGWGHPSPLQTYYSQNNLDYPFTMLHTANYRGHVAIWEISDNMLFLKEIQIDKDNYKPGKFNVKSQADSLSNDDKVLADWFSGVIIGEERNKKNYWKVEKSYYFYVRYGKVVNTQELTDKDFEQIENISEKDTANQDLMAKYSMLYLNSNYISYYFRINGNDTIAFDAKGGYLTTDSNLSPVLSYYENDHMKWPYNWENFEKSGAPFGQWLIRNDSLLLISLELHTGTGFYSIDKFPVDLTDVFPNKVINNSVFGEWVSGIMVVRHGMNVEDELLPGYVEFKPSEYTYLRLKAGMVLEKYTVPLDFDFENMPDNTDEGLKNLLNELSKSKPSGQS